MSLCLDVSWLLTRLQRAEAVLQGVAEEEADGNGFPIERGVGRSVSGKPTVTVERAQSAG